MARATLSQTKTSFENINLYVKDGTNSAATLTYDTDFVGGYINLLGSTAVSTINGGVDGMLLLITSSASASVTTGGNIELLNGRDFHPSIYTNEVYLLLIYDSVDSKWHELCRGDGLDMNVKKIGTQIDLNGSATLTLGDVGSIFNIINGGAANPVTSIARSGGNVTGDVVTLRRNDGNGWTLPDTPGAVELGGGVTWGTGQDNTITLYYDGSAWIEICRSA